MDPLVLAVVVYIVIGAFTSAFLNGLDPGGAWWGSYLVSFFFWPVVWFVLLVDFGGFPVVFLACVTGVIVYLILN
jgi:hypothetical protein